MKRKIVKCLSKCSDKEVVDALFQEVMKEKDKHDLSIDFKRAKKTLKKELIKETSKEK
jgi:hypothetical protein